MKKQLLLLFLMMLPLVASADAVEINGIYYNLITKTKEAEVTNSPKLYKGEVNIPNSISYDGSSYSVTSISSSSFNGCSGLTAVTIPNSVTFIDNYAFSGCYGLTAVYITDITAWCKIKFNNALSNPLISAKRLFLNGDEIKELIIPNSVTSIGDFTFRYCTGLTSVTIPNNVTSIGNSAFEYCSSLTSVTIPDHITSVANNTFAGCTALTSVTIPNSVASIGNSAFYGCSSLTTITIPNSVTTINDQSFAYCSSLTTVIIGNGINIIYNAFGSCPNLTDVTCYAENVPITTSEAFIKSYIEYATLHVPPASIDAYKAAEPWKDFKEIISIEGLSPSGSCGENVSWSYMEETQTLTISGIGAMTDFSLSEIPWKTYCNNIKYVKIEDGVTHIGSGAFYGCEKLISVDIPQSVTSIGNSSFFNCFSLTTVIIPQGTTSIGAYSFAGCSNLSSVTVPNSVNFIGESAFAGCKTLKSFVIPDGVKSIASSTFHGCLELTSITIPNSINSIDSYAFYECPNLISVAIPNSVTSIGECAFSWCSGLVSIDIPNSVKEIGKEAFAFCSSLNKINIPDGLKVIEESVFGDCHSLTSIVFPNGLEQIGKHAFHRCTNIASINIPNSVKSIEEGAFQACISLASVSIPQGITSIEKMVFNSCYKLTTIELPNNLESIGECAFESCNSLAEVNIPNNVTTIKECAFRWCEGLTTINIPDGVTRIEAETFSGCYKLNTISLPPSLNIIHASAFKDCKSIKSVTIPKSVEYIYQNAFYGCTSVNKIRVLAINPPFLYDNSFSDYSVPLNVPKGRKEAYQTAQGWKNFTNIIDSDKYKLTYTVDGEVYKSYDVEYGATITPEAAPTKEGYTFSGWSEIPTTMPAHDVTVTGTFSVNKYKLTYMVDGVEYKSYDVEFGATITPEAAPTKEGYTFSGWSEIPATMPAHDVTVSGTFTVNKYKLTYKVDGAEYKSYDVEYGTTITPEAAPTKEGHTFSGWSEIPTTMPAHDVTVTGTFSVNKYKLAYTVDGVEYKSYDVEFGATITPEAAPTKEGYTFSGWSEIPATMPAHDVTVTGTFSVNKYKLAYTVDGVEYKSYDVEFGATITPEAAPTKEGYTFSGWSEIPATMPAHDVTVTGTFTQIDYVVGETTYEVQNDEVSVKDGSKQSGNVEIQTTVVINDQTYKVTSIADNAFKGNTAITSVTIPNSITQIGTNAFEGCISLSEINIGNAVSSIGSKAFANITSASNAPRRASGTGLKVSCYAESVPSTASNAFENTSISNGTLLVEDNSVIAYKNSAPWSGFGTIMGFKEATGIERIWSDKNGKAKIFSIDGKPLNTPQKGVNIINGKKYVKK